MSDAWDAAVGRIHPPTPLLGLSPDPQSHNTITRNDVSRMLSPLKKHLLLADSVYFRDSFYYCFDWVADTVDRSRWRNDPNTVDIVQTSIQSLKRWLPILIELRALIESKALVFMPYYITPSFPYDGAAPKLEEYMNKLLFRSRPRVNKSENQDYFSENEVIGAWLNSRIMQLDPVFPNRAMFDWATNLYLDDGLGAMDLTSDLISLDILPFGGAEGIALDDLESMRKNEEVFRQVQCVVGSCKDYIEGNIGTDSTKEGVSAACKTFLRDQLNGYEKGSILKFIDEKPAAGIVFSLAVGAALIPLNPVLGVIAGALMTPQLARIVQRRLDPKRRAIGHLQALL